MIRVENNIAWSDAEGKELQVIGTGMRGKRFVLENGLTVDALEEVSPIVEIDREYGERVNALIRERYTLSEELAILRQRDSKAAEFAEYNDYCELCKQQAKSMDYEN